jgi:hypothetical protein
MTLSVCQQPSLFAEISGPDFSADHRQFASDFHAQLSQALLSDGTTFQYFKNEMNHTTSENVTPVLLSGLVHRDHWPAGAKTET